MNDMTGELSSVLNAARDTFLAALPAARRVAGERRFQRVGPRLLQCLEALYGDQPGFATWLPELCSRIGARAARRPAELHALDADREMRPDWFVEDRLIGYAAYVDRFGGTLHGVGTRINHLKRLGVGYLHLLPFLKTRDGENDGGFAVSRFDQVEPALGSMHDLAELTGRLRSAGISLCADLVLNHVADDHPWAERARRGDAQYRRWFHVFPDRGRVDAFEAGLNQVFPEAAPGNFSYVAAMDAWVWTTFYTYQWDLNYAEPAVFAAMADAMLHLANQGVEVFRLDSVPYLWKRLGTACINEPEVHLLLAAFRAITDLAAPASLLLAEAITPTRELVPYFGSGALRGHACHLAYQSSLMAAAWASLGEGSAELVAALLRGIPSLPEATGWLTYVRCHDDIVWGVLRSDLESAGQDYPARMGRAAAMIEGRGEGGFGQGAPFQYGEGELLHGSNGMTASLLGLPDDPLADVPAQAMARMALMYGLAFWIGTIPMIYMGDELGQVNNADPRDAARIDADGRWMQRPLLDAHRMALADLDSGVPARTLELFGQLRAARERLPLSGNAVVRVLDSGSRQVLALARGERERAWFNFSGDAVRIDTLDADWSMVYPDHDAAADAVLAPWGMRWGVRES